MADRRVDERDLVRWAATLAGVARTGLGFTESQFERERYEEVLAVAADIKAVSAGDESTTDVAGPDRFVAEWLDNIGEGVPGYITPKVAVGAVVGNDDGQMLLIQRKDSGVWLYPTGWADVGYSASEVAVKEVEEETGIECEPVSLLAVIDALRMGFSRFGMYMLLFHCRATGGELYCNPHECGDVGWFERDELPEATAGADWWADWAFDAIAGGRSPTTFDPPRRAIWRAEHTE